MQRSFGTASSTCIDARTSRGTTRTDGHVEGRDDAAGAEREAHSDEREDCAEDRADAKRSSCDLRRPWRQCRNDLVLRQELILRSSVEYSTPLLYLLMLLITHDSGMKPEGSYSVAI